MFYFFIQQTQVNFTKKNPIQCAMCDTKSRLVNLFIELHILGQKVS